MSTSATFLKLPAVPRSSDSIVWSEFSAQPIYSTYPKVWPLLALALAALVFNLGYAFSGTNSGAALGFLALAMFLRIAATCYWLFCVYRFHRILAEFSGHTYPISPNKAFLFQMIPVVGYYWSFRWTRTIAGLVNQRGPARMRTVLPGAALAAAALFGVLGSLPAWQLLGTVRIVLLFATGVYLTRKLRIALPEPDLVAQNRLAQLKLAASVGIGSAFSLMLARAIEGLVHLFQKDRVEAGREILACVLVAIGMVVFLEPAFEMLRERIGLAEEHHHPMALHRPWRLRLAAFVIIALPSIAHTLLHQEVADHTTDCFKLLAAVLLASGGVTYCWFNAARCHRSSAMRSGLLAAAFLGTLLFFAAPGVTAEAANSASHSSRVADLEGGMSAMFLSAVMSDKDKFFAIVVPLLLVGLAGGLAIDRKPTFCVQRMALAIVGAAVVSTLFLWAVDKPHEILPHLAYLPAGAGWALALLVGPSSQVFATETAAVPVRS